MNRGAGDGAPTPPPTSTVPPSSIGLPTPDPTSTAPPTPAPTSAVPAPSSGRPTPAPTSAAPSTPGPDARPKSKAKRDSDYSSASDPTIIETDSSYRNSELFI